MRTPREDIATVKRGDAPTHYLPQFPPGPVASPSPPTSQPRQPAICLLSLQIRVHVPELSTHGMARSVPSLSGFYFEPSTLRCISIVHIFSLPRPAHETEKLQPFHSFI